MGLTYELAHKFLKYDPETGLITRKINSGKAKAGSEAGTLHIKGYRSISISGFSALSHRTAWLMHYGKWPDNHIDHINGINDDNRIVNLRDVTNGENHKNMKTPSNNTSGFRGVYWNKPTKNWRVKIEVDGSQKHIGYFKRKYHAVQARIAAEIIYGFHENHGRVV